MNKNTIINRANYLSTLRNTQELGVLLKTHPTTLALICLQPHYKIFRIPKKNGEYRLIEDPEKKLKAAQRQLNLNLQCWYFTKCPAEVHGFCIAADGEEAKGIYSNAMTHVGKPFLLNMDFQDYFHQINEKDIFKSMAAVFKSADKETIKTIVQLVSFKERLPMGAPTSPVLANICSMELDLTLKNVCKNLGVQFTRYADDLSFSAGQPISQMDYEILTDTIIHQGFDINHSKTKFFGTNDIKMVTGLVLKADGVGIPEFYLPQLQKEIEKYLTIKEVEYRYQTGMSNKKLKLFEQELLGKINFAESILGKGNAALEPVYKAWMEATNPMQDFESANWLDIPYNFY